MAKMEIRWTPRVYDLWRGIKHAFAMLLLKSIAKIVRQPDSGAKRVWEDGEETIMIGPDHVRRAFLEFLERVIPLVRSDRLLYDVVVRQAFKRLRLGHLLP